MDHIKMKTTTHFDFLQIDKNENENEILKRATRHMLALLCPITQLTSHYSTQIFARFEELL